MLWLYNIGIFFYNVLISVFALFNHKARLFKDGRKNLFSNLEKTMIPGHRYTWFHFASLGEFEQGRPVVEKLKSSYPDRKIIITFFSPSGYEIRKNYALADAVFYLPVDTKSNAKRFLDIVKPELAIFTKYEFWHHYFNELKINHIPLFLISGIFRSDQLFFKSYGRFYRNMLKNITHLFVQNEESVRLLKSIGITDVSLSGDTRFDRVAENAMTTAKNETIELFTAGAPVFIAGSTWPQDETLIASLIKKYPDWKVIIAPHEVAQSHIQQIEQLFPEAVKYSVFKDYSETISQVLIIDNIGLLSSLYQYGKVCYIGGGFGAGIHNTLEAAAFGLPVIFGPNYHKFQEAKDLIDLKAAISINTIEALEHAFQLFAAQEDSGRAAKNYVNQKKGATAQILKTIEPLMN
jgi:3-deoxy-D-manno-octulosonic-acid transferase